MIFFHLYLFILRLLKVAGRLVLFASSPLLPITYNLLPINYTIQDIKAVPKITVIMPDALKV